MKPTNQPTRSLLYSPEEAATGYVKHAEWIQAHAGITWGVTSLDRAIIPMRAGDVTGIIARPGHGKSTLGAYLARHTAKQIIKRAAHEHEAVVYVTFEQSIEEIETLFQIDGTYSVSDFAWGKVDMELVKQGAINRTRLPVWLMGRSINERAHTKRMTVENVYAELREMESVFHIKPTLIVFDYLQLIPVDGARDRTQAVNEAIMASKELSLDVRCPLVLCVQAARTVDKYETKIPTAGDCQWASAIEQTCDKLLGIWRPALTEGMGDTIEVNKKDLPVHDRLFIAKLLKQRMGKSGQIFSLNFAPEFVRLCDLETNTE